MQEIQAIVLKRWERREEEPLPSEDGYDQCLYLAGMIDGVAQALHIHLTEDEQAALRRFAKELCGIAEDFDE